MLNWESLVPVSLTLLWYYRFNQVKIVFRWALIRYESCILRRTGKHGGAREMAHLVKYHCTSMRA